MAKKSGASNRRNVSYKSSEGSTEETNKNRDKKSVLLQKQMKDRKKQFESTNYAKNIAIFSVGFLIAVIVAGYFWQMKLMKELVITPLNVPNIIDKNSTSPASNPQRFWGSYRSGVYFGMKARSPSSPNFGNVFF